MGLSVTSIDLHGTPRVFGPGAFRVSPVSVQSYSRGMTPGHDRMILPMPASRRKGRSKSAPHTRYGPQRDSEGLNKIWQTTKRRPWTLRAERRAAGKRQRQARKINRG